MRGPPQKTFLCVFCEDEFYFVYGDSNSFKVHFGVVHKVFSEYDILLAIHFMEDPEKNKIVSNIVTKLKGDKISYKELDETGKIENATEIEQIYKSQETQTQNINVDKQIQTQSIDIKQQYPTVESLQNTKIGQEIQAQEIIDIDNFLQQFQTDQKTINISLNPELVKAEFHEADFTCKCTKCKKCLQKLSNFTCIKCGSMFKLKRLLKMHSKKKWGCTNACYKCDKVFTSKRDLEVHIKKKYSCILNKERVCEICGKKFKFPIQLEQHNKRIFSCHRETKCGNCGKIFKQKIKFERHNTNRIKYGCNKKCNSCGKELRSSRNLAMHTKSGCKISNLSVIDRSKFTNSKRMKRCEICLKLFTTNTWLRKHMRRETKCDSRLECALCGLKLTEEKYKIHIGKPCVVV